MFVCSISNQVIRYEANVKLCKLVKSLSKLCLSTCIVVCSKVHVIYCLQVGQRDDVIKQLRADLSEAQSQQRAVHDDVSADASIAPSLSQ